MVGLMTNQRTTANGIPAERFGSYTHYPTATVGNTDKDELGNKIKFERSLLRTATCSGCDQAVDMWDTEDGYTGCCNEPQGEDITIDTIVGYIYFG